MVIFALLLTFQILLILLVVHRKWWENSPYFRGCETTNLNYKELFSSRLDIWYITVKSGKCFSGFFSSSINLSHLCSVVNEKLEICPDPTIQNIRGGHLHGAKVKIFTYRFASPASNSITNIADFLMENNKSFNEYSELFSHRYMFLFEMSYSENCVSTFQEHHFKHQEAGIWFQSSTNSPAKWIETTVDVSDVCKRTFVEPKRLLFVGDSRFRNLHEYHDSNNVSMFQITRYSIEFPHHVGLQKLNDASEEEKLIQLMADHDYVLMNSYLHDVASHLQFSESNLTNLVRYYGGNKPDIDKKYPLFAYFENLHKLIHVVNAAKDRNSILKVLWIIIPNAPPMIDQEQWPWQTLDLVYMFQTKAKQVMEISGSICTIDLMPLLSSTHRTWWLDRAHFNVTILGHSIFNYLCMRMNLTM